MGLTNNEVKFLVTLDIDEDKSKKKIDGFLEKTIKDQKITFDVAVGKSEHNINEFLKKHKEKKASILFDVAVGKSNHNISEYLSNRKQDTQSLIFYVNEGATKSKINSALATMQFNNALIELGVKKTESLTNINNFIDNAKTHKKLIELDINDTTGFTSINSKIDSKQLNKAKLSFMLAQGAFDNISETVQNKVFSGVKFIGELDVEATKLKIERQINKMKLPKLTVDVEPIVSPITQPSTPKQSTVKQNTPKTSTPSTDNDDVLIGSQKDVFKQIKEEYKALGKTVELFNKDRVEGEEAFINALKRQGKQVDIIRDAQTKEITKITTTFKNSSNEVQKDVFVPIIKKFKETGEAGAESVREIRGFVNEINKLKNTENFNLTKEIEKFKAKLEEARHSATITAKALNDFGREASNATSRNQIDKLNQDLKTHQAEQRKRNQLEKEQINLISQQEQLMANLIRIEKMYLKTVKKEEADAIRANINAIKEMKALTASGKSLYRLDMGDMTEAKQQIIAVRGQIKNLNAEATEASKNSMGIISSLKTAMEKFPIWMIASTAFYGTIRTFHEFGSIIVDIDKKMTDLKKVMSDDTDFGLIFERATASAETFGKTISETMDAYIQFAKQGYKGEELEVLSNAGLVAGNVGDIQAGKASEYLTASLLQWNKDSSEAMSVVDSWNEVSNNFATTVENLAQGQSKAGATARALGMDFDQLNAVVGTLNARTKQSGNEIGNFVKSTFANILSNKGRDVLSGLGVELENADGTMRDIMDIYKEVAVAYKDLSQADKNSVTLGLAGKYHISRMQTLLDDLGSVESMYDSMYKTSQNSANSAMEENQKYMQSLEARINLAKVEIEKLALAIGEAFMTEGMIQALQMFRALAEGVTTLVKEVGFLPVAFLGVVTILTTLSNRFGNVIERMSQFLGSSSKIRSSLSSQSDDTRALTQALSENSRATGTNNKNTTELTTVYTGNTKETNSNTESTDRNTEAKKRASKASKMLSLGFGALGVASLAVGFGIEKLLGWISKARQEQEDYENTLKEQIATFEANEETIISLSKRYSELSKSEKALDPSTQQYAELTEVQNELARLLPEVKKGEDGLGNSIVQSAGYIEQKVAMMEKQLEIQRKLNEEEAKEKSDVDSSKAREQIEDSKKEIDSVLRHTSDSLYQFKNAKNYKSKNGEIFNLREILGLEHWDSDMKDAEQLAQAIAEVRGLLARQEEFGFNPNYVVKMEYALEGMVEKYQKLEKANLSLIQSTDTLRTQYAKEIDGIVGETDKFEEESLETFKNVISGALGLADTEEAFESLSDGLQTVLNSTDGEQGFADAFLELNKAVKTMQNDTLADTASFKESYKKMLDEIKAKILELSGYKVDSPEYKALEKSLDKVINSSYNYEIELRQVAKESGKTVEEVRELYDTLGDGAEITDNATNKMQDYVDSIKSYGSVGEKMLGVTDKLIDETDELSSIYNYLSNATNKTAEEEETLADVTEKLTALYPHLVKNGEFRIDQLKHEQQQNLILKDSFELLKEGKYSAEQEMTYYSALGTKARIQNLAVELEAMEKMSGATYDKYEELMAKYNSGQKLTESEQRGLMQMSQSRGEYTGYGDYAQAKAELEAYTNSLNTSIGQLSNTNARLTESVNDNTSSTKENSKEVSELDRITNKYATSLEKLNTQLSQVQAKQRKYPTYSKQYRQALQEEINLLNQQIGLNEQKANELGGVSPTTTTVSYAQNSSYSGQLSGWNHNITSGYGASESFRNGEKHTGVDIDGYMGETLQANVAGKVIDRGYTAKSGNYIKVQDANGYNHFYGHLKTITAKLDSIVQVGDKLGEIGNTGNVWSSTGDGSHLHYEIKVNGKNIDPTSFAKNAKGTVNVNVGTTTAPSKSTGNTTKDSIWNYFKSKGLSDNAVAGIMGNIQQESSFNANAGKNAPNNAYGLVQWRGSRREGLNAYAKSVGKNASDLQVQLDYIWKELNSTEKKALNALQTSGLSASQYAEKFDELFERSGKSQVAKRKSYAESALATYKGTGGTANTGTGTGSFTITDDGDYTKAVQQIEQLKRENLSLGEQAQELYYGIIKSTQEEFQRFAQQETDSQARQETIKRGLDSSSEKYEQAVNAQYASEEKKYAYYKQEYDYLQKRLDDGGLTSKQADEMKDRRVELVALFNESKLAIKEYYSEVVDVYMNRFEDKMNKANETLAWEETKIQSVDKASTRYNATLKIMAKARQSQLDVMKQEQTYIDKQLSSGKLTQTMYDELKEKASELKKEVVEATLALQQLNYEMIQSKVSVSDERLDDYDFNIERSKAYSNLYEEGSADQKRELNYQLDELNKKLLEVEERGKNIQYDMRNLDLGHEKLQELEEQLEDNALAYLDVKKAISDTKKELQDFDKIIDEKIKDKRTEVIDDILDALKDSYRELSDIEEARYDKLLEEEEKRHDKVMKNYEDELEAFTDIIDKKRRDIEDSDRDRTHDMNVGEITKEIEELQRKINLLSNVNTYDGKKEREELQKQLDEARKKLVEENYSYEKEVRLQALDDELDERTEHYEKLQEEEDKKNEETVKDLEKQKAYYKKYYDDLINDEAEFLRLRKEMEKGNFEEIQMMFDNHGIRLKESLADLEDTFDGTWTAVGTQIRENVIAEMENLLNKIGEVEEEVKKLDSLKTISNEHGSSVEDKAYNNYSDADGNMSEADLKVILAKFMNEQIASTATSDARKKNIKDKATILAQEGRAEGSTISADKDNLDKVLSSLSTSQLKQVGDYFQNNASESGFSTQQYLDYIKAFGVSASQGEALTRGDKQVMMAKYINEKLTAMTDDKGLKESLRATSYKIAETGRANGSIIPATVNYDSQYKKLTEQQRHELGEWMVSNSSVVSDGAMRSKMEEYAENLALSNDKQYVKLNTGGMTKAFGSSGGIDGKGGKMAVLHQREIVLNPLDTERILKVSSIMDNIMNAIGGVISLPSLPSISNSPAPTTNNDNTTININVARLNGTQSDIDNLAKQIQNRLLREKGKR